MCMHTCMCVHVCSVTSVMSDCFQSHGLQPARLLCPWDFPGKNIGVGSHALLQGIFLTQGSNPHLLHCRQIFYSRTLLTYGLCAQLLTRELHRCGLHLEKLNHLHEEQPGEGRGGRTLCDPYGLQPARFLCPWNFPGKNTGVDCHFLLQGIFLIQVLSPCLLCLLHWRADSLPSSHLGSLSVYRANHLKQLG